MFQNENEIIRIVKMMDKIVVDTSSIMHFRGFNCFIKNNKKILVSLDKKIIVPQVVWWELIRAYNSSDKEKKKCAEEALNIISRNRDIIDVEGQEVNNYEIEQCFADPSLLCDLIIDRTGGNVLFITNDKMLSGDAYDINYQKSCRGYMIETYYIDEEGNLLPGYRHDRVPQYIEKEVVKYISVPDRNINISSIVVPIIFFIGGFIIDKYGSVALTKINRLSNI